MGEVQIEKGGEYLMAVKKKAVKKVEKKTAKKR
jgi:hypothetical protein